MHREGDTLIFVGCAHEEPCPELVRPCSVQTWGPLTVIGWELGATGDDTALFWWLAPADGEPERFDHREVDTVANVAERAAAGAAADLDELDRLLEAGPKGVEGA